MPIDDEIEKSAIAADIREESERTIQSMFLKSALAGKISLLPFGVGSAINEMMTQLAFRRVHERMQALMEEMTGRIRDLGEDKIDREFFRGEEFQTLIFEAIHQLHVTHHKKKIEMLGKALANSGANEFKEETNKELFMQLVRYLSPQHIDMLHQLLPRDATSANYLNSIGWQQRPEIQGAGANLLILQMLAANGLAEEKLKSNSFRNPHISSRSSPSEIQSAVGDFVKQLQQPPRRCFCLSDMGRDFLRFVGPESPPS